MNDAHYKMLMEIQRELTKNTEMSKFIHEEMIKINGRVTKNVKAIARINKILLIIGTAVGTLLYFRWPDVIKIISLL